MKMDYWIFGRRRVEEHWKRKGSPLSLGLKVVQQDRGANGPGFLLETQLGETDVSEAFSGKTLPQKRTVEQKRRRESREVRRRRVLNWCHGAPGGILSQEAPEEAEESGSGPVRRRSVPVSIRGQRQQSGNWPHLQSPQVHFQVTPVTLEGPSMAKKTYEI